MGRQTDDLTRQTDGNQSKHPQRIVHGMISRVLSEEFFCAQHNAGWNTTKNNVMSIAAVAVPCGRVRKLCWPRFSFGHIFGGTLLVTDNACWLSRIENNDYPHSHILRRSNSQHIGELVL